MCRCGHGAGEVQRGAAWGFHTMANTAALCGQHPSSLQRSTHGPEHQYVTMWLQSTLAATCTHFCDALSSKDVLPHQCTIVCTGFRICMHMDLQQPARCSPVVAWSSPRVCGVVNDTVAMRRVSGMGVWHVQPVSAARLAIHSRWCSKAAEGEYRHSTFLPHVAT